MAVHRSIGKYELLVEPSEPCGIQLEEDLASNLGIGPAGEINRKQLLKTLAHGDEYFPLTTHWELLDRCNLKCPFCYIVGRSSNRVVRFSEIQPHLENLVSAGLLFAILTGGEPTIHPDFHEIYSFLKSSGVVVEVFSNGLRLTKDVLELFSTLPPSVVEVSLYSFDDKRLGNVFGAKETAPSQQLKDNLLSLKAAGIPVGCKTFENKLTVEEILEFRSWCGNNGIPFYSSSKVVDGYDGTDFSSFSSDSRPNYESVPAATESTVCFPCGTVNYGSAITSAFELYPCPSIQLPDCRYDIRELGVSESIARMKSFMRKHQAQSIRGSCAEAGKCANCIAYAVPVRDKHGDILHFAHPG